MSKRAQVDRALILATLAETGNQLETARRLGVHRNTVFRVAHEGDGKCVRCRRPAPEGQKQCDDCLAWTRENMRQRRIHGQATGTCTVCGKPLSPTSAKHCPEHQARVNETARERRSRLTGEAREDALAQGRRWNRKQLYGTGANEAWDRDNGCCALCGTAYERKWSIEVHHIDGNHENTVAENMVLLCVPCHKLVHALLACRQPVRVIEWVRSNYDSFCRPS